MLILIACCFASHLFANTGEDLVKATGVTQGLCLVVDDATGDLTVSLAKASGLYVQGSVQKAAAASHVRQTVVAAGLAHRASAVMREGEHLPYNDNLINLLVVADHTTLQSLDIKEVLRVLAPGGFAAIAKSEGLPSELRKKHHLKVEPSLAGWLIFRKPVDPGLGDWTHFKGGADQSYVSDDAIAAPWKEIQWIGDPRWGSLYTSYGGFISKNGRIYYKENRASKRGSQWWLIARDAFNGAELWRVKSGAAFAKTHLHNDYTLTCDDSHVYLAEDSVGGFPARNGVLVARRAKTGELEQKYELKFVPQTVTVAGDFLIASTRTSCAIINKKTGDTVWDSPCNAHPPAVKNSIFVASAGQLQAIEASTGKELWKSPVEGLPEKPRFSFKITVMHKENVVYVVAFNQYGAEGFVAAFDSPTGKFLWRIEKKFSHGVLPFKNEVWCMHRVNKKNHADNMDALVLDSRTGKIKRDFTVKGHVMSKCWNARASANQIMYSNGWYLNRLTGESTGSTNTRSPCVIGQNPANGLTYFLPHHCDCQVTIRGFLALGKPGARRWFDDGEEKGATALFTTENKVTPASDQPGDWPVYRKDAARSAATPTPIAGPLKKLWSHKLGETELTQTTIAYDRAYTAEQRAGRVFCRDAKTGKAVWSLVADGRIEFPPTLHKGMCLFGTCAGSVYCLNAADGKELWRMRAAPTQKFIGDRNQFASSWPVIGGVLVFKDTAYFSVGRTQSQLGGMWLCGVQPTTGKLFWRQQAGSSGDMFVATDDLLVHTAQGYKPATGEKHWPWKMPAGVLQTTRYLTTVSIADYMATVEPNLSHKKHIELSDGRIRGDCLAFNKDISVAGWRYTPGTPGWKEKENTNKYFVYATGAHEWKLHDVKHQLRSIILAGDEAVAVGVPTSHDSADASELWVLSTKDGKRKQTIELPSRPIYDGLSAAQGRLYLSTQAGELICFGGE